MPLRSLVTATFSKKTYSKKKGFEFPAKLHALFGFRKNDRVALLIARPSGEVVFCESLDLPQEPRSPKLRHAAILNSGKTYS
jgi:hypothetical protein